MKRSLIFATCLIALPLSLSVFAQNPQDPRGARQRGGHHGGKKMKRMDTNHDGSVSREEWKGKPKAFDRIDKNNDGVITMEEIKARRHKGQNPPGV